MLALRPLLLLAAICLVACGAFPPTAEAHVHHVHHAPAEILETRSPAFASGCHDGFAAIAQQQIGVPVRAGTPDAGCVTGCCVAGVGCCGLAHLAEMVLPDEPLGRRSGRAADWLAPPTRFPEAVPEPPRG